jgi:UDP-N-acetylmuramoylalanine--D-glutamate ligase
MNKTQKKFPKFKNKKVLILGLGLLGRGVKDAIFFAEQGADVTVTDLKTKTELAESIKKLETFQNVSYTLGKHEESDILNADLIIRNAGIPQNSKYLKLAKKHKKQVDMDESLFAEYCPCPIIGITGTRGKSTTTTLIGKMLQSLYKKGTVYVSGNLQGEATLPLISKVKKNDLVVLELSSWQLQGFGEKKISPQLSIFTNVYPDHMNSYKTMKEYVADKKFIFQYQKKKDHCLINANNKYTKDLENEIKSTLTWFSGKDVPRSWELKLLGKHNRENVAAALALGEILGFTKDDMKKTLTEFPGLEHRLEFVQKQNNITFINDTTSTTPISGVKALQAIDTPIVLIAGGATKKLNLKPFAKEIVKRAKSVILLEGSATDELEKLIIDNDGQELISGRYDNFEEAIKHAYAMSLDGDTVLLSPGCASFGMFINEFDRGNQFKKIVKRLN